MTTQHTPREGFVDSHANQTMNHIRSLPLRSGQPFNLLPLLNVHLRSKLHPILTLTVTSNTMASTLSRMTMRRAAPIVRAMHTTPTPLAALARRVPTPANKPTATASAPSRGDMNDIFNEVSPASRSSAPSSSTDSSGGGNVSPPLNALPGENYEPLPSVSDDGPNWSTSFAGMGSAAFPKESIEVLLRPLDPADIEIKPGESPTLTT